jgi:nucleotide-binding universal stress UspA family protein
MAIAPSTAEIETSASALLREAIDSLAPDISVTSVVLSGPVGQALAREARRQDCDVIVVGRGRRLLRRGPSPAERFLRRHADVPVVAITVPSRRAAAAEPTLEPVLAPIRPAL